MKNTPYQLAFWGAAITKDFPRYKRHHETPASVLATIDRVFGLLAEWGMPTACHTPVIYDRNGNQISLPQEAAK